jgi:putative transposase
MANTYRQIYIQTVFAVKKRDATINKEWSKDLFAVIGNLINEEGGKTYLVNGIFDHVHCFFGVKPSVLVSDVMKTAKAKSSKWVNDNKLTKTHFEWQEGYGAFSYSHSQKDAVYKYVENQEEHHKLRTFREEYLDFLIKFDVPYDERYIFKDLE